MPTILSLNTERIKDLGDGAADRHDARSVADCDIAAARIPDHDAFGMRRRQ